MLEGLIALEASRSLKRWVMLQMASIQQDSSVYCAAGGRLGHRNGGGKVQAI
jgi:hypothetical protein